MGNPCLVGSNPTLSARLEGSATVVEGVHQTHKRARGQLPPKFVLWRTAWMDQCPMKTGEPLMTRGI